MSVRTTVGLQQSVRNGWPVVALAYIDHPDGAVRVWSGVGSLEYAGATYEGIGFFGRVRNIGASKKLTVRQVIFELRGVPPDSTTWLSASVRNRSASAWIAGMDERGKYVNGTAWQIVDGTCNYQELKFDDPGAAIIELTVSEPVVSIERAQNLAWTPEWIRDTHGADVSGLDRLSELASAQKSWTRT